MATLDFRNFRPVSPLQTIQAGDLFLYQPVGNSEPVTIPFSKLSTFFGGGGGGTTYLQQGSNVTISGTGTIVDPYVISSSGGGGGGGGTVTPTSTDTFSNKTISGSNNTLSNISQTSILPYNGIIDGNRAPYNCTPGGVIDASAGLQAAIDAAYAYAQVNESGFGFVELDPGTYKIDGALQTDGGYYSIIKLPRYQAAGLSKPHITIGIRSKVKGPNPAGFWNGRGGSVVLKTTKTSQIYSNTFGWPTILGGPDIQQGSKISYITLYLENITFVVPTNPTIKCIGDKQIDRVYYRNVSGMVQTDFSETINNPIAEPTSPLGRFNDGVGDSLDGYKVEGSCWFSGLYSGIAMSEHFNSVGAEIWSVECKVAVNMQSPFFHPAHAGKITSVRCPYVIAQTNQNGLTNMAANGTKNKLALKIEQLDIEEKIAGDWRDFVKIVHDPTDVLSGVIFLGSVRSNVGSVSNILKTGASFVKFIDLYADCNISISGYTEIIAPPDAIVYATDTFNRADGGVGNGWTVNSGTWVIESQQLKCTTTTTTGGYFINSISRSTTSNAGTIKIDVVASGNCDKYLGFRFADINNTMALEIYKPSASSAITLNLFRIIGGTMFSYANAQVPAVSGNIAVTFSGTTATVKYNGVPVTGLTNIALGNTVLDSNTGVFIGSAQGVANVESGTTTLDNFDFRQ